MHQNTHTTWRPQRRRNQRRSRLIFIASRVSLVVALLFLGYALLDIWLGNSDERYYFTSSQYNGVTSKFVTRDTVTEKTSIEYPITNAKPVNNFIAKEIQAVDQEFRQTVRDHANNGRQMTQTISYQISHHTDQHISLTLHIKQDTLGAHPIAQTKFWTLRKADGVPVTTRQLLGDSDQAMNQLVTIAKQRITALLEQRGKKPTGQVTAAVSADTFQHFLVRDSATLSFPFSAGAIVASSYGEISIAITVADLQAYMQHPLAQSLFTVPKPTPPAKAPTPPPQHDTNTPCANQPCISLTFDDGPGPHTERLLDILRDKKAKATFFVLGSKATQHPDTLRRMQREGHTIGNHTWNHPNLTKLSATQVRSDISRTNDAIKQAIGQTTVMVRAPYGAVNPAVNAEIRALGMASIMWSVDTRDWADRNSAIICQRAVAGAQAGSVILLHDIHATSVDAVPCIIDGLAKQGYRMATVEELFGTVTPGQHYYSR